MVTAVSESSPHSLSLSFFLSIDRAVYVLPANSQLNESSVLNMHIDLNTLSIINR